jgi:hypothetical protein
MRYSIACNAIAVRSELVMERIVERPGALDMHQASVPRAFASGTSAS